MITDSAPPRTRRAAGGRPNPSPNGTPEVSALPLEPTNLFVEPLYPVLSRQQSILCFEPGQGIAFERSESSELRRAAGLWKWRTMANHSPPSRGVPVLAGRGPRSGARAAEPRGVSVSGGAGKPARRFLAASSVSVVRVDPTSPPAHLCAWHLSPTRIPTRRGGERSEGTSRDGFPAPRSGPRPASAGAPRSRRRRVAALWKWATATAFRLTASAKAPASLAEALRAKAEAGSHNLRWRTMAQPQAALPRRAGAGRTRPAPRGGKTVSARTLAALAVAASRDARVRHMPGAQMRRWWRGIYADHRDRTRRAESPRRFSCFGKRRWHSTTRGSAARGPLQTGAAAQHRHGPGGQRVILRSVLPDLLESTGSGSRRSA